ncbi:hypothetical protein TPAR_00924, partial [Tolypocladium paradoxum]
MQRLEAVRRPASPVAALARPSSATGLLERNQQPVTAQLNAVGETPPVASRRHASVHPPTRRGTCTMQRPAPSSGMHYQRTTCTGTLRYQTNTIQAARGPPVACRCGYSWWKPSRVPSALPRACRRNRGPPKRAASLWHKQKRAVCWLPRWIMPTLLGHCPTGNRAPYLGNP